MTIFRSLLVVLVIVLGCTKEKSPEAIAHEHYMGLLKAHVNDPSALYQNVVLREASEFKPGTAGYVLCGEVKKNGDGEYRPFVVGERAGADTETGDVAISKGDMVSGRRVSFRCMNKVVEVK